MPLYLYSTNQIGIHSGVFLETRRGDPGNQIASGFSQSLTEQGDPIRHTVEGVRQGRNRGRYQRVHEAHGHSLEACKDSDLLLWHFRAYEDEGGLDGGVVVVYCQ